MIASCGLLMFITGQKGKRVLTPNTSILSHQYSWGSIGKEHELFARVRELELTTERMINHYKKCTGLTEEEIQKMKADAEANADADAKAKETADKVNGADSMIFQTEKQLKEFGDKLSDDKKAPIEEALSELKKAHESKDLEAIDSAMETINTAWTAASEEMYKASQTEGSNSENADTDENTSDDVTDVEFEEVKEE